MRKERKSYVRVEKPEVIRTWANPKNGLGLHPRTLWRGQKFVVFRLYEEPGYVTVAWSWTGLVQKIPAAEARLIWKGLWVMGFKERKPAPPPKPAMIRDPLLRETFLSLWGNAVGTEGYSKNEWQGLRDRLAVHNIIV